jgi:two-component SAPR family response regulator
VWSFERLIGKVDAAWNEIAMRSAVVPSIVRLAEKALRMYSGPFLAGDNEPWAISMRERLRNKLLRNVTRLGLYWEEAGNREKAIECYQKGLEVDELMEEFYRRIIKCYLQMGRRAEALAICTRCRTILTSVLGVEPSPETIALGRDLKC